MAGAQDSLLALYREADQLLDGWTCDLSGDCCHFARTGREPYLWPNEWALLERAIAARGVRRGPMLTVVDDRRCPLLGRDGRCTVYEARPFGCRTFFCDRGRGGGPREAPPSGGRSAAKPPRSERRTPRAELAAIGRRIADLAQREYRGCDGPRPLSSLLASRKK